MPEQPRSERRTQNRVIALFTESTHSERFMALISRHYPAWREARAELNELPLGAEAGRL